jgi:hypothetical protein
MASAIQAKAAVFTPTVLLEAKLEITQEVLVSPFVLGMLLYTDFGGKSC